MAAIRFVALALMIVLVLTPEASAITCSDVAKALQPCIKYLKSGSGSPPGPCCAGAKSLAAAATSKADKQTACTCLKNNAQKLNPQPALAKALPGNCGISLGFAISTSVDCTKIS